MKKLRISLLHRSSKNKNYGPDKVAPVYVLVSLGRKYACIPTGIDIPGRNWNATKERVVGLPNAATLTREILDKYYEVIESYQKLSQKEHNITPKRLKEHLECPVESSFSKFYRREMAIEAKDKAYGTGRSYAQTINLLDVFQADVSFEDICNPSLILDFTNWLRIKKGQKKNNVHKHYKNLRKFINLAILRGFIHITDNPIPALKGKVKTEKVQIVYLTDYELDQLENLQLEGKKSYLIQVAIYMTLLSVYAKMNRITLSKNPWGVTA